MSTSRKLIVYVVLALMLFVGASSAAASSPNSHEAVPPFPVSFTIPAGQYSSLPAGVSVSGTGTGQSVYRTQAMPDGRSVLFISTVDNGTATDSNGGAHTFTYQNNSTFTLLPSGQVQVSMNDTFVLSGPGPQYNVGFNWRWTFTPPAPYWPPAENWEQLSTHGDPFSCDPL